MSSSNSVTRLIERGVVVPAPDLIHVAPEVDARRIEAGVVLHPGCRLEGAATLIRSGARLGTAGPCRVRDCAVGRDVELQSGTFEGSVFFDGASHGPDAQVRAGTLFEEGASAAHAVGTKQTLLLPFATLGSNVNFCDALLAGGTGPKDHSEVGSGFIHFNFTPFGAEGDKATPSLFGDAVRGVWLREARVFLGGAGGVVGPLTVGFGTILAAGAVYRRDYDEGLLVIGEPLPADVRRRDLRIQSGAARKLTKNLRFMAQVTALWAFHAQVRRRLARNDPAGLAMLVASTDVLRGALEERVRQLTRYAKGLPQSASLLEAARGSEDPEVRLQRAVPERLSDLAAPLADPAAVSEVVGAAEWDAFVSGAATGSEAISWVRALDQASLEQGRRLLARVAHRYEEVGAPLLAR